MDSPGNITRLILEWQRGGELAENALFEAVYQRIHGIALHLVRGEARGQSMGATDLVHEAYLRFRRSERLEVTDSSHFLRLAARVMRQILVDRARARRASKRQGDVRLETHEMAGLVFPDAEAEEIIAVDRALNKLAQRSPRLAEVVELRYFAEFSEQEAAEILGVSSRTVRRDWSLARVRLREEIDGGTAAVS